MDDSILSRARHAAVDAHKSVSGWVKDLVARELDARDLYEQNRKGALLILKEGLSLGGRRLTREEAHDR